MINENVHSPDAGRFDVEFCCHSSSSICTYTYTMIRSSFAIDLLRC